MVGLSVVLEAHKNGIPTTSTAIRSSENTVIPLVINKATMVKPPPPNYHHHPAPLSALTPPLVYPTATRNFHLLPPPAAPDSFLDVCFLCRQKLLPGKDIYMYKGDRAFCSEDCRWKQMLMDEEDQNTNGSFGRRKEMANNNCSLVAMKPISATASSSTTTSHNHSRATRNAAASGFAR